jgi:hypothetical protein
VPPSPDVVVGGVEAKAEAAGDTWQASALWVRLPPDIQGTTLRDLLIHCRVDAGQAERYLQRWRERGPWPEDPAVTARFQRLYAQEVSFQAFLADQLAQIVRGDAAGVDVSAFTSEELEAFRLFLEREIARLELDTTRMLHPDYPIREIDIKQSMLYRFSLKRSFCDHLRTALSRLNGVTRRAAAWAGRAGRRTPPAWQRPLATNNQSKKEVLLCQSFATPARQELSSR